MRSVDCEIAFQEPFPNSAAGDMGDDSWLVERLLDMSHKSAAVIGQCDVLLWDRRNTVNTCIHRSD
jgi:hypothetical protein